MARLRKLINEGLATYDPIYDKEGKLVTMVVKSLNGEVLYYENVKDSDKDAQNPFVK